MSLEAKRTSILKSELGAGIYQLLISDLKLHKKSNGEIILYEDNPAVIVTFSAYTINTGIKTEDSIANKVHQELYWIGSTNYTKLQKIILQVGLDPAIEVNKKDFVGKTIWGAIQEIVTMRGSEEIKRERKLIETFETEPNYKKDLITYTQEGF